MTLHSKTFDGLTGASIAQGTKSPTVLETLAIWGARRRQRRALARLDDHGLTDVGVSRDRVEAEIAKPFWVA